MRIGSGDQRDSGQGRGQRYAGEIPIPGRGHSAVLRVGAAVGKRHRGSRYGTSGRRCPQDHDRVAIPAGKEPRSGARTVEGYRPVLEMNNARKEQYLRALHLGHRQKRIAAMTNTT